MAHRTGAGGPRPPNRVIALPHADRERRPVALARREQRQLGPRHQRVGRRRHRLEGDQRVFGRREDLRVRIAGLERQLDPPAAALERERGAVRRGDVGIVERPRAEPPGSTAPARARPSGASPRPAAAAPGPGSRPPLLALDPGQPEVGVKAERDRHGRVAGRDGRRDRSAGRAASPRTPARGGTGTRPSARRRRRSRSVR